ncbi:hypothetical protein FB45DRAFT_873376 [Roridomyces roridus]|uniref:Uncharacterized protein n=1 Tax=Roridomyces roridus TaxID=1738132 RepID=A0AAD7BB65_9AGAR|nr:hypothetical protein FB45DRAFT_873376 [Roridomyces roridus]
MTWQRAWPLSPLTHNTWPACCIPTLSTLCRRRPCHVADIQDEHDPWTLATCLPPGTLYTRGKSHRRHRRRCIVSMLARRSGGREREMLLLVRLLSGGGGASEKGDRTASDSCAPSPLSFASVCALAIDSSAPYVLCNRLEIEVCKLTVLIGRDGFCRPVLIHSILLHFMLVTVVEKQAADAESGSAKFVFIRDISGAATISISSGNDRRKRRLNVEVALSEASGRRKYYAGQMTVES